VRPCRVAAFAFVALWLAAPGVASAGEPKARVEGVSDRALRLEIERAVGAEKTRPATRLDARRRAREAAATVIAVLRSEGFYDYVVAPRVGEGATPEPVVQVTPGPRSTIAAPRLVWDGRAPDPETQAAAAEAMDLRVGAPGRAADVLAAEGRIVAVARKRGYADAIVDPRQVIVDHEVRAVEPTFHVAAGDLVRLDGLQVVARHGRTRAAWIASLATWKQGAIYDPRKIAELERRLRDVGIFDSVTVALAPADKAVGGLRPVIVSLADRPPHTVELGAGYDTSQGAGADATWINYNLLHRADTLTLTARLAQIQQKLDLDLALPDWRRGDQTLKLGGDIFADQTPAYNDRGAELRADVVRHYTRTTFITIGGAVDAEDTFEKDAVNANAIPVGRDLKLAILSGLGDFALDRSDNPLDPTRGWRLEARLEPAFLTGDRTLGYLKTTVQASGYLPLEANASTVLAGRLKLGSILGGKIPDVPADRRFFSGGGGSVRGYPYQGVGPTLSDGTPIGGDSLFEVSGEVRQHLAGPWGVAAFVDAGAVGPTLVPDLRQVDIGAGVGLRYDLGFGPVRIDLATPLDRHRRDPIVQIYLSIGQSF